MSSLLIFFFNLFFLIISSYHDIKKRVIPNRCVLFIIVIFFVVNAGDVLSGGASPGISALFKWAVCPVVIIFLFFPAEILTGKRLGCGDKKVLMALSLSLGFWGSILLIFVTLVSAAFYHTAIIVVKKKWLKVNYIKADDSDIKVKALPMAPFMLAAYCVVFFH